MRVVNQPFRKTDSMDLVTGKPVYLEDIVDKEETLVVKLLRSPHANAFIEEIDTESAMKVPGIEVIFTWKDIDQNGPRYTGDTQAEPAPVPYDRLLLDRHVRHVGDVVACVAGKDEKCVDRALKLIKVKYEVLPAILDFREALDNPIIIHPEDNYSSIPQTHAEPKRNLVSHREFGEGDAEAVLKDCDVVIDEIYHTRAVQQEPMETFRSYARIDEDGHLSIISATQIIYHMRQALSLALGIPKDQIRFRKPRVGGSFGSKETMLMEGYIGLVTLKTRKPSMMIYSRKENCTASCPRHEMQMHVRIGANRDGIIRVISLHVLSNTGAYAEHSLDTIALSGFKSIPLYGKQEAWQFIADVVYTNKMTSGAYRGYGATQGLFAVESAVNELALKLNMDPAKVREMNLTRKGEVMVAQDGYINASGALDVCLSKVREMIDWENKYKVRRIDDHTVRVAGMAMSMQGSALAGIDVGGANVKAIGNNKYRLTISAADLGTGCDTVLAQIAAETLGCELEDVTVIEGDTDSTPFDSGSFASSTTYLTGKAVKMACEEVLSKMAKNLPMEECEATIEYTSPVSPPPFMVGACELEVDTETGQVKVLEYDACVDCGTPINPHLARVQAEGGIGQAIGMALFENIHYDQKGRVGENSLMQYKIPTRLDYGPINVEFAVTDEPTGPFGAKSIGEVVTNTPGPAIADALSRVCGYRFRELPITPEQIAMKIRENKPIWE